MPLDIKELTTAVRHLPKWLSSGAQVLEWNPTTGRLEWYTLASLSPSFTNLSLSGWERIGSLTAPTNTTAGDLSVARIFVPDQATGLFGLINVYDNAGNVPLITRQDSSATVPAIRVWAAGVIPAIQLLRSRSSVTSPTAVQSGDTLGRLHASGFVDANTISASTPGVRFIATENWSSGNEGSEARIAVTPKTTNLAQERLKVADPAIEYTSYSARAKNSSGTQSIAAATATAITFNAEDYDTGTMHDNSSATSRLTAPIAGRYAVSGGVVFAAEALSTTTYLLAFIAKNGVASVVDGSRQLVAATAIIATIGEAINVSCDVALAANDYVELGVFFDAGVSNRTITSTLCAFSMHYIGGF